MTHLERFINNVTPLDAKHLNELVNTLNILVDNNESTQLAIRNLNAGVQNIEALRTQLDTIENTVDEHIENCSDREIELQVGNGYIQWRYKNDIKWNNLISITDLQVPGPQGPQGIPGNDGVTPDMTDFKNKIDKQYETIKARVDKIEQDDIVEIPIVGDTLTLTTDKLQKSNIKNNTTIILPVVDKFTEIHLFFNTTEALSLILPSIKWQSDITIEANKRYEFIFTYVDEWMGGVISYNA